MKILHFADAHIDISQIGPVEPELGIPARVRDFLNSLDEIVDTAIEERVDLVLFAGDAYKDRTPHPTYQREWEKRILRLSQANIPTLLLTGNHDMPKAMNKAHALTEFETLKVPNVRVVSRPSLLGSKDLGLPVQVVGLPWLYVEKTTAYRKTSTEGIKDAQTALEDQALDLINNFLERRDPSLPTILLAHASIRGAKVGDEKDLMLGGEFQLSSGFVKDPRFDYVALGHIHYAQNLNGPGPKDTTSKPQHPPVIYSGSIERVNFGEADDDKYFVIADVSIGKTDVQWRKLQRIRPFVKKVIRVHADVDPMRQILVELPAADQVKGAVVHIVLEHPESVRAGINEDVIRSHFESAFDFRLSRKVVRETRSRLPIDENTAKLSDMELLDRFLDTVKDNGYDREILHQFAKEVFDETNSGEAA